MRACADGLSWFSYPSADDAAHDTMSECSDMGTCDRSVGLCTCADVAFLHKVSTILTPW